MKGYEKGTQLIHCLQKAKAPIKRIETLGTHLGEGLTSQFTLMIDTHTEEIQSRIPQAWMALLISRALGTVDGAGRM